MNLQEKVYVDTVPRGIRAILGADIGGTNSNFGFFELTNNKLILLFSLHTKSKEVSDFTQLVKQVQEFAASQYDIFIQAALFASAGVVSPDRDRSCPTNLPSIEINAHAIRQATAISCVYVVNDFEVIGYGIDLIDPTDLVKVHNGPERKWSQKAILGAGTGLGKSIMFWNHAVNRYVPVASEGGHADFAAQRLIELDLVQFIQRLEGFDCNVSWEDVLSGNGIQRIYQFFHSRAKNGHRQTEQLPHPDEIFNNRNDDKHSWDTFELYTKLYARCAKNLVLDALALGGIYIAGGIAAHNLPMFELTAFVKEFINCGKQGHLLEKVPVFVITDYNVSLWGAAHYLVLEGVCKPS